MPSSNSSPTSKSGPTYSFTKIKFDITNKICNKCRVIKQITCFDKKKSMCTECNSTKVKCEYCPSIISFSGLSIHIKNSHEDVDLTKGIDLSKSQSILNIIL